MYIYTCIYTKLNCFAIHQKVIKLYFNFKKKGKSEDKSLKVSNENADTKSTD